jgi:putative transposase
VVTPAARREAARYLRQAYEMSERRACRVIGSDRASVRYQACAQPMMSYASG